VHDDEPRPTLTVDDVELVEGNSGETEARYDVHLSGPVGYTVILEAFTEFRSEYFPPNSATEVSDYIEINDQLSFAPGVTSGTVKVTIHGDTDPEPDEQLRIVFFTPSRSWDPSIPKNYAIATIRNDDAALEPRTHRLQAGSRDSLSFNLGNPFATPTLVELARNGDAVEDLPSSVTVPAGETRVSIPFTAARIGTSVVSAHVVTPRGVFDSESWVDVVPVTSLKADRSSVGMRAGDRITLHLSFWPAVSSPYAVSLAFSGSARVTVPSTVIIPAGGEAEVTLEAMSAGGGGIVLSARDLLISAYIPVDVATASAPLIDALDPAFGSPGGGTRVEISGSGFSGQCTVSFGGTLATISSAFPAALVVRTPPHNAGIVDVRVSCPTGDATKARAFTYTSRRAVGSVLTCHNGTISPRDNRSNRRNSSTATTVSPTHSPHHKPTTPSFAWKPSQSAIGKPIAQWPKRFA
jgi:hypothetical protein